jgi:hypothetical protein
MPSAPRRPTTSSACSIHVLCGLEVLGLAAGNERLRPTGLGSGKEQRRAEPILDVSGGAPPGAQLKTHA